MQVYRKIISKQLRTASPRCRNIHEKYTIFFIHIKNIPKDKKVTYIKLVAFIRLLKEEVNRVRVTVERDKLEYNRHTHTILVALSTVKIYINSTKITPGTHYYTADVKDFYYGTLIDDLNYYKYEQMLLSLVLEKIIKQYDLLKLTTNNRIYFEIRKGMLGLKQVETVVNIQLVQYLNQYSYIQSRFILFL